MDKKFCRYCSCKSCEVLKDSTYRFCDCIKCKKISEISNIARSTNDFCDMCLYDKCREYIYAGCAECECRKCKQKNISIASGDHEKCKK